MTNDVGQRHLGMQGIYSYDKDKNGKPSWVSLNSGRIWYDTSYNGLWKIGAPDMSSFGIVAHPIGWIGDNKTEWHYWNSELDKFVPIGADMDLKCTNEIGTGKVLSLLEACFDLTHR